MNFQWRVWDVSHLGELPEWAQGVLGGEPEIVEARTRDANQLLVELHREQKEKFKEVKANFFAAELLMPMEQCKRVEHENESASQEELTRAVMKRFGVSRQAATYRVEELRLGMRQEGLFAL